MIKKSTASIFVIIIIFLSQSTAIASLENNNWWDDDWPYRQEIAIPINTEDEKAIYQPIDTQIIFEKNCWAKNEDENSIRVIFQEGNALIELESQIYELNKTDEEHIKSCNLVFLIPPEANGKEKYYIYYDSDSKTAPKYPDHVRVEESYYRYEPIPGYPFESEFFKITQDGEIIYGIAQNGEFLGLSTAHQITKFMDGTEKVTTPENAESWASFDYFYYYGNSIEKFSSTIQKLISKEIFVDGNLMVEVEIKSGTPLKDFETTARYKYYHCPMQDKRIYAHVKHEALKETKPTALGESFGNILGIQAGSMRSPSIKELNFGRMYPFLHVYSEDNTIREYKLDLDPEYTKDGIIILDAKDDVDLGDNSWASFDEGESGEAHAIILASNSIIKQGADEKDGVQVQALEGATPGLLGLETDLISFYFSRNAYESGSNIDLTVPEDFIAEYDAEFYSPKNGGYNSVNDESSFFQSLIKIRPASTSKKAVDETEKEKYSLTTFVHLAPVPSANIGTFFSLLTGLNFSYITGELYRDGELISTGLAERLPINQFPSITDQNFFEKIKLLLGVFDWNNLTFFKKIRFQNLEPGTYLIKIYKENPILGKERKFIGYKIVEVNKDSDVRIFCGFEGEASVSVLDEKGNGLKDVSARLIKDDIAISDDFTKDDGSCILKAPCNLFESYYLNLIYKGFLINSEQIKLGILKSIIPIKKEINVELYDLKVIIKDKWGLPPSFKLNPILTSSEMIEPYQIYPEDSDYSEYDFKNLIKANYNLNLKYKSFLMNESLRIPQTNDELSLTFPVEFKVEISVYNSRGIPLEDAQLIISRNNEEINLKSNYKGITDAFLPPGVYNLKILYDGTLVGERKINVLGDRPFDIATEKEPLYPAAVVILAIICFIVVSYFLIKKNEKIVILKVLAIILSIISIVLPWWALHGSATQSAVETDTIIYLLPPELVTITSSSGVVAGELGFEFLPDWLSNLMLLFSVAIILSGLLIFLNIFLEKKGWRRLSILCYFFALLLLIGCVLVFFIGTSALTKVGVGSFIGSGNIDVNIPGENLRVVTSSSWGPGVGFILSIISIIILLIIPLFSSGNRFLSGSRKMSEKNN